MYADRQRCFKRTVWGIVRLVSEWSCAWASHTLHLILLPVRSSTLSWLLWCTRTRSDIKRSSLCGVGFPCFTSYTCPLCTGSTIPAYFLFITFWSSVHWVPLYCFPCASSAIMWSSLTGVRPYFIKRYFHMSSVYAARLYEHISAQLAGGTKELSMSASLIRVSSTKLPVFFDAASFYRASPQVWSFRIYGRLYWCSTREQFSKQLAVLQTTKSNSKKS